MTNRTQQREEFLSDVITTAVEGGIGYWSQCSAYRWCNVYDGEAWFPTTVTIYPLLDDESDYEEVGIPLTIDKVASAIAKLRDDASISVHSSYVGRIVAASRDNDCGELDAGDCDIIVQVAILGDVIYG